MGRKKRKNQVKTEAPSPTAKPWPIWGKILFWVLSPFAGFLLMFFYIYAAMTFLDSMAIHVNLLSPGAVIVLGILYAGILMLIERPFVRHEHMKWWQYGLGAYVLSGLFTFVLWINNYHSYQKYPEGEAGEDLEFMTYLFGVMSLYVLAAAVFRLMCKGVAFGWTSWMQKKNQEKLDKFRARGTKQMKDTSRVFRDEE